MRSFKSLMYEWGKHKVEHEYGLPKDKVGT